MRLLPSVLIGGLLVGVAAEAAYIAKTRSDVAALEAKLAALVNTRDLDEEPRGTWGAGPDRPAFTRPTAAATPEPGRLPPPRFTASPGVGASHPGDGSNPLPLPAALDTPEARQQLSQYVAAEVTRVREEERDRFRQRREQDEQRRLEEAAKTLGLNPDETRRLTAAMSSGEEARRELRRKAEAGEMPRDEIGRQFAAMREQQEQELRQVLGDERLDKFREIRREAMGGRGQRGRGSANQTQPEPGPR